MQRLKSQANDSDIAVFGQIDKLPVLGFQNRRSRIDSRQKNNLGLTPVAELDRVIHEIIVDPPDEGIAHRRVKSGEHFTLDCFHHIEWVKSAGTFGNMAKTVGHSYDAGKPIDTITG